MTSSITKSSAAVPSSHILVKLAGAIFSKPCHLQVQDVRLPEEVLDARLLMIVEAKMMVNRVAKRERNERMLEMRLRLWSFRGWKLC